MSKPKKPPYRPQSPVELVVLEDGSGEIQIGFRTPIRRIRREDCDLRIAMSAREALNLYNRLKRALERHQWRPPVAEAIDHVR